MLKSFISKNGKNFVFGIIVVAGFFLSLEGILWLFGVDPLYERVDPFVGFSGYSPLFVEKETADNEKVYVTAENKINWFNHQEFPVEKEEGVTRIFCLGGSTTYGRPYDDRTSFAGWLRQFLTAVNPNRQWEVINAGGISYASYRVARLMKNLAEYDPDLFVIYTGHNEFLENRTYDKLLNTPEIVRDAASIASRLRIYTLLSDFINTEKDVLPTEVDAILDRSVGPDDYYRDDEMQDAVLEHFRVSLERMVDIGEEEGADLLFVTPASNIKDFSPFKTEPAENLDPDQIEKVERLKESITESLENQDAEQAAALVKQALSIDARDAELLYYKGNTMLALGKAEKAREAFIAARDEDIVPLRALTPIPEIVTEVAEESGSGLVDFEELVEENSPHGIPGEDLFLDHVHPTIEGNRMLALAIINEMIEMGEVTPSDTWNEKSISRITEEVKSNVDEEVKAMGLTNLSRVLSWAGKQEEATNLIKRATEITEDQHTLFQMVNVLKRDGRYEEALPYAAQSARLMPNIPLVHKDYGILLALTGRQDEARNELETAAKLEPEMEGLYYHLGLVYSDLGNTEKAVMMYQKAISIEPDNVDSYNNLALLYVKSGNPQAAYQYSAKATQLAPDHPSVRKTNGYVLANLGRDMEALKEFRAASQLDENMTGIYYEMGLIFSKIGNNNESEKMYRKEIELDSRKVDAYNNLGILLAQKGDLKGAIELFEQALQIEPGHTRAMNNLNRARAMRGRQ